MKTSIRTFAFRKTAACPASATLLSFRTKTLTAEATEVVIDHLEVCDFCCAELPLLAHQDTEIAMVVPEIPISLRILAESILGPRMNTEKAD